MVVDDGGGEFLPYLVAFVVGFGEVYGVEEVPVVEFFHRGLVGPMFLTIMG